MDWDFYYVSAPRLRHNFADLLADMPLEEVINVTVTTGGTLDATGKPGDLVEKFSPVTGEVSAGLNTQRSTASQTKKATSPEQILHRVIERLRKTKHTTIDPSTTRQVAGITGLVRFYGVFTPQLPADLSARTPTFLANATTEWRAPCGPATIHVATDRTSFVTLTPVYPCLLDNQVRLQLDGYGTVADAEPTNIWVVPLILGRQL